MTDQSRARERVLYEFVAARLSSEYQIVQDKIDKIGAFRFTIRGWTVTLVTGAILAVASASFLSPYAPLFLLILLGVFASIESKQNRNQEILEDRAFEIEVELRRLYQEQSGSQSTQIVSPRIAHTLRDRSIQNRGWFRQCSEYPDRWFYWVLAAVVIGAVVFLIYVRPQRHSDNGSVNVNISNEAGAYSGVPEHNSIRPNEEEQ